MNKGKDSKCNSTGFVACFQIGFPVFLCITHVIKGNEKTYNSWKEIPGKHRPRIYREEKIEKNNEKKAGTNAGKSGKKNRGLLILAPLAGIMVILIGSI